ncbi:MAG: outer membrane beta-barrel protein [Pseudomonadota bacterium]
MNKTLVAALAAVTLSIASQSAFADSHASVKDHGYSAPANWNGAYVGLAVGYTWADSELTRDVFVAPGTLGFPVAGVDDRAVSDADLNGVTGTVTLGYDRMLTDRILAGVFVDYTFGDVDGDGAVTDPVSGPQSYQLDIDDAWSVGGRIGYLARPDTLIYVSAGYTEVDVALTSGTTTVEEDHGGYFIGVGLERVFRESLTLSLDYRYSDYEQETQFFNQVSVGGVPCCSERIDIETDNHAIRLGLNFRFAPRRSIAHTPLK